MRDRVRGSPDDVVTYQSFGIPEELNYTSPHLFNILVR
jgi:hypothetical protein